MASRIRCIVRSNSPAGQIQHAKGAQLSQAAVIKTQNNNSARGFSIVEVLVVIGLFAIIAVGVSSMISSTMKQQKGIQAKDQQREVTSEIRNLLSRKEACKNTFGGQNPLPLGFSVTSIKDDTPGGGIARYTEGTLDKTGLLRFDKFSVDSWLGNGGSATSGKVDFKVSLSKVENASGVKNILPDTITLVAKRNAGGNIEECYSIGTQSDGIWQKNLGDTSIYYNGGNVGIGTGTPIFPLSVQSESGFSVISSTTISNAPDRGGHFIGMSARGSAAAPTWPLNGDVIAAFHGRALNNVLSTWSGMQIFASENQSSTMGGTFLQFTSVPNGSLLPIEQMRISSNGNVGIGTAGPAAKLDVNGTIKSAAQTPDAACGPLGAQGYNSTTGAPLYCANTGKWTAVGGGGGGPCVVATQNNSGQNNYCPAGHYMRDIVFPRGDQDNASAQWAQITCCPL